VSLADLIVLGGGVGVEQAAKAAGHDVVVPFTPGRTDATQAQTDASLVRGARATRRRLPQLRRGRRGRCQPEALLVDRAQLLTLSAPELTVLVGGLRVLGVNVAGAAHGVLTTARAL
jgi:catalase-peroxidase